jgi:CRISPR-associated protein Csh2
MSDTTTDADASTPTTRSEIVFLYDAEDCNPNGDPYNDNEPRLDQATERAVVTDVRLKRYLRDQLDEDGHGVFIRKPDDDQRAYTRLEAALQQFEEVRSPEDFETVEKVKETFLNRAADVRYFGATFSFDVEDNETQEMIQEKFGANLTGPVQFSPTRSLNRVELNTESRNLTSVLRSGTDVEQGTFADDKRLKYAIFPFHGIVNEQAATDTALTTADVRRLDTLCWRALKNQTLSRSKLGQEPRLYLRAAFDGGYHHGGLHRTVDLAGDDSPGSLRSGADVTLDVSELVDELVRVSDRLQAVHVCGSSRIDCHASPTSDIEIDDAFSADAFPAQLDGELDAEVRSIDVWDEYTDYLPSE